MNFKLMIEQRAEKELSSLEQNIQNRIKDKIKDILKEDPLPGGKGDIKKIKDSKFWRLRIGDHRVFYDVDKKEKIVYILSIKHRSKAYDEL